MGRVISMSSVARTLGVDLPAQRPLPATLPETPAQLTGFPPATLGQVRGTFFDVDGLGLVDQSLERARQALVGNLGRMRGELVRMELTRERWRALPVAAQQLAAQAPTWQAPALLAEPQWQAERDAPRELAAVRNFADQVARAQAALAAVPTAPPDHPLRRQLAYVQGQYDRALAALAAALATR